MPFVEIVFSDLEFFERLGEGAAGSVYRGKWKSKDTIVAIKKLLVLEKEVRLGSLLTIVGWRSKAIVVLLWLSPRAGGGIELPQPPKRRPVFRSGSGGAKLLLGNGCVMQIHT